ncbi:PRC-barrel domain-containing protein [Palleronia sp.]|uniref:PRC-barrel domain-containing protein n=1 Tax=Palleronia sp. TaxID=1940284 RepID=UPI0035C7B606
MFRKSFVALATFAAAGPAFSQEAASILAQPGTPSPAEVIVADDIEDADILSLEGNYSDSIWNDTAPLEAMVADLNEVGEIEDVVLGPGGQTLGLTTDVGGFLGIGQKTVLIPLQDIRLVRPQDGNDISIVTRLDKEALRNLPEFEAVD